MPAPNVKTNSNKATMEYEVLVIPPPSPNNETFPVNQPLRTRTKRINCNSTNGSIFWIPEGYRPVLVRTADLPLLSSELFDRDSYKNSINLSTLYIYI
ncbi:hypothetical protein Glove_431g16 [Diversispora epigaea]|uniref:Uncharacterized protein n=1 Tax=Diversispora epigaea TaxID=1348612 RepID=A0A397GT98_9GLOM|nr:hypothetical protein Glove_431g16 [Diversispora epigaea]